MDQYSPTFRDNPGVPRSFMPQPENPSSGAFHLHSTRFHEQSKNPINPYQVSDQYQTANPNKADLHYPQSPNSGIVAPKPQRFPQNAPGSWIHLSQGQIPDANDDKKKSLVDLIQEDFPRTPSPVYQKTGRFFPGMTRSISAADMPIPGHNPRMNEYNPNLSVMYYPESTVSDIEGRMDSLGLSDNIDQRSMPPSIQPEPSDSPFEDGGNVIQHLPAMLPITVLGGMVKNQQVFLRDIIQLTIWHRPCITTIIQWRIQLLEKTKTWSPTSGMDNLLSQASLLCLQM